MEPAEKSKKRAHAHPWINASVHFLFCFAVGALISVAPLATTGASSASTIRSPFLGPFNDDAHRAVVPDAPDLGLLLIVTVTRPDDGGMAQEASVARLAHTLRHVAPPLLWIVVGPKNKSRTATATARRTVQLLRGTGLMFRHLTYDATNFTGAGDEAAEHQRNVALSHIERHRLNGVVHFAAASSVYDLGFFQTLRQTRGLSAWPVATISPADQRVTLEGPTCNSSHITGWYSKDSNTNGTQSISNYMGAAETIADKNSSSDHSIINISGIGFRSSLLWNSERSIIKRNSSAGATQDFMQFIRDIVILDGNNIKGVPSECFETQITLWHMDMPTFTLNTEEEKEMSTLALNTEEEKEIEQQQNLMKSDEDPTTKAEEENEMPTLTANTEEEKDTEQQQNLMKSDENSTTNTEGKDMPTLTPNTEEEKEIEQHQNLTKSDEDPTTNTEEQKEMPTLTLNTEEEKKIEQQHNLTKSDEDPTINTEEEKVMPIVTLNTEEGKEIEQQQNLMKSDEDPTTNTEEEKAMPTVTLNTEEGKEIEQQQNLMKRDEDPTT